MSALFVRLWCILSLLAAVADAAPKPNFKHAFIVIFENVDYSDVINLPFFSKLASEGALLTNFHAEAHPSQPNYVALVAGDPHGVTSDDNFNVDAKHIGDLLEAHDKTWKVYAEAYPGNCYKGARKGTYVRKHNPFISFKNIQSSPERCAHIVNASVLAEDIKNGTLPDYSFYVPDLNNDGHDTGPEYADKWYQKTFGPLLTDARFTRDLLLISTFDESGLLEPTNHIYTSLWGEGLVSGSKVGTELSHYDLLRTIEEGLATGTLGENDNSASVIAGIWK